MTQIEDKEPITDLVTLQVQDGMELINLLLHTTDETSGCHDDQPWSITSPQILAPPPEGGTGCGADCSDTQDFLEVLLGGSSETPASSAPVSPTSLWSPRSPSSSPMSPMSLWSPASPSDSGLSEDLDSPPPPRPRPPASPPYPGPIICPNKPAASPSNHQSSSHEKNDICIDLHGWESDQEPDQEPDQLQENFGIAYYLTRGHASRLSTNHTLSVKDLLLSNLGQKAQRSSQNALHELVLNEDEKKLLAKEGVNLPSKLPLSKFEERVLKKIRRKIRNKRSAQESRKKKKEYVDSLEGRMAACSAHNLELQRKVQQLEQNNTSLLEQLSRMQALLANGKTPQKGTCILVLLLSLSLLLSPSLQPDPYSHQANQGQYSQSQVVSRSLQSVEDPSDDDGPPSPPQPSPPLLFLPPSSSEHGGDTPTHPRPLLLWMLLDKTLTPTTPPPTLLPPVDP